VFLLNVGLLSTGYTELYARRQMSSQPTVWEFEILNDLYISLYTKKCIVLQNYICVDISMYNSKYPF
jgi:hypothetical protein